MHEKHGSVNVKVFIHYIIRLCNHKDFSHTQHSYNHYNNLLSDHHIAEYDFSKFVDKKSAVYTNNKEQHK